MPPLLTDADGDEDAASRERRLRYRVLLAEYRTVLVLAFVVLLALGGWVSYGAYADPGETRERRLESEWTATGSFTHSSVVTEPKAGYSDGERLEGEPLYYESVAPTVDGEFDGGYDAARADDVTVDLRVDLVYRAVDPDDDTVYWSERESLASVSESDVEPNETVTASVSVNVTAVRNAIDEIETDLEASPGETEVFLEFERGIAGTIDGEERSVTDSYEVAIEGEAGTYRLESDESFDEPYEEYTSETVAASPGTVRTVGGPALALLGAAGLGGVGAAIRRYPAPTREEREWLSYRDDRSEFDEVITTARLPAAALEGPRADVESLAALARLGIDLESAVVFDPERRRYVVGDDDLRYVFEPPRLPVEDDVLAPVGAEGDATAAPTDGAATDAPDPAGPPVGPTESDTAGDAVEADAEPAALSTLESADDARSGPESATESDSDAEPATDPPSENEPGLEAEPAGSIPDAGSTADVDDDDLLALVGLEPSDLSEPDLFDPDGGREDGRAAPAPESADDAASDREDRDGPERRFDAGL